MKRIATFLGVAFYILLVAGCTRQPTASPGKLAADSPAAAGYVFYPPLPNTPRYQFLATISDSDDVGKPKSKLFDFVVGEEREKPMPIKKPYGLAVWGDRVFVCDMKSGLIVIDLKLRKFDVWGLQSPGLLGRPVNVAIDRQRGEVFVADIARKQVLVFDGEGRFLKSYGTVDQFEAPVDVAVTDDRVFVCDVEAHTIHVLDRESGATRYQIGQPGSGPDQLFHPTNIKIMDERLYVSDTTNFRIQIFSLKGKPLDRFGQVGDRPGTFSRPKGIAVDREERVYVVDAAFENIQVFDKDHKLLLFFLEPGNAAGMINLPADVEISYEIPDFFRQRLAPGFDPEYLLLVSSQFGANKVNVYAFGSYRP